MQANDAEPISRARTFLFVPGSRPDRFDKAVSSGADVVIIDLEDAVAPQDKVAARAAARSWLEAGGRAAVRVNGIATPWLVDDLAACMSATAIVFPKAESAASVARVAAGDRPVIPLIESPVGLARVRETAAVQGVVRLAFGNVDFACTLGVSPDSRAALTAARSKIVYASSEVGCAPPVDGVTTALWDTDTLRADVIHARELGFTAKLLIHPGQVAEAEALIRPQPAEIEWAREIMNRTTAGLGSHRGHMVDQPVIHRAQEILAAAGDTAGEHRLEMRGQRL